jgi:DNA invertase Pin-like site-specific DNA recombinase
MTMNCKIVPYRRVSTKMQGQSGLGLDAQDAAIQAYAISTGCDIIGTYTEIETAKRDELADRPELVKAIRHAKRAQATLVIAKLDRLVRSTVAMAELKKSGVKFVACDMPSANEFTIDIHVAVAAEEARKISQRTKDALKAYKAGNRISKRIRLKYPDGVPQDVIDATAGKLGGSLPQCRTLTPETRARGIANLSASNRARADEAYADLVDDLTRWRADGLTPQAIADRLNAEGHTTRRQKPWNRIQVTRVLARSLSR